MLLLSRSFSTGQSKKALALAGKRGIGEKLIFDDDGEAHALYELQDEEAFKKQGDAKTQAQRWAEEERERMQEADIKDKELAKEKRREKRRRQKEREKALERGDNLDDDEEEEEGEKDSDDEGGRAVLAPIDNRSDGYETPDFELSSAAEDDDEDSSDDEEVSRQAPASKRRKIDKSTKHQPPSAKKSKLEQEEELALRLLAGDA